MNKIDQFNGVNMNDHYYSEDEIRDGLRIQKVLLKEEKLIASLLECFNIWERYSGDLAASWLFLPEKDNEILEQIKSSRNFTSFEDYAL